MFGLGLGCCEESTHGLHGCRTNENHMIHEESEGKIDMVVVTKLM